MAESETNAAIANGSPAPNVCYACKLRKKACDKALPSCGFCKARALPCRYDIDAPDRAWRPHRYNPGKHFVALPTEPDCSVPTRSASMVENVTAFSHTSHVNVPDRLLSMDYGRSVAEQGKYLMDTLKISIGTVQADYFGRSHCWLYVISPKFFNHTIPKEPNPAFSADISILVLSMWLLTSLTTLSDKGSGTSAARQADLLYSVIKSQFSRVQGDLCASIPLIQGGMLLAECEYARGRPKSAYVTLGNCIAMARVLGMLNKFSTSSITGQNAIAEVVADEEVVISWALSMMERYDMTFSP